MNLSQAKEKMEKTFDLLKNQLTGISSSVNVKLVASVRVTDSTGQKIPVEHIAMVGRKDKIISVIPHNPAEVSNIEKALKQHGFNAFVFSKNAVAVNVPSPSGEEKIKISNLVKKAGEETKVSMRNIRKTYRQKNAGCDMLDPVMDSWVSKVDDLVLFKIDSL